MIYHKKVLKQPILDPKLDPNIPQVEVIKRKYDRDHHDL